MAITGTTTLTNSVQSLYQSAYMMSARRQYIYSQEPLVYVPPQGVISRINRGSAVVIPIYGELVPGSSLSQTADITAVTNWDSTVTVTPELYGNAVQISQKLSLTAFTDVEAVVMEQIARNMVETTDKLARSVAIGGAQVMYGGDATSRVTCSPAATTDEIRTADFLSAVSFLKGTRTPEIEGGPSGFSGYAAVVSHPTYADLIEDGAIILIAEYGQAPEILLNGEIGAHIGGVRLVLSNYAKQFRGAGAKATASSGTLSTAAAAGSTNIQLNATIASGTAGLYYQIGTVEAGGGSSNDYDTTETVLILSTTSSAVNGVLGAGPNGGLLYAHSSGENVSNNYDVQATVFLGAQSIAKVYTDEDGIGPDGVVYPPEVTGLAKQFNNVAWKHFVGFARAAENRVFRVEHAASRFQLGH